MLADMPEREIFDNITFRVETPEGNATIIVVEDSPGTIYDIQFLIGKAGAGVNAWAYALAKMTVEAIKSKGLMAILPELSNITSSRTMYSERGIPCRSGPEALYLALFRYNNMYKDRPSKGVTYDESYEPPRMRN